MSSFPRKRGCPPINATAASVETRVLVLRLLNNMATVWPAKPPWRELGVLPDLTAFLWEAAFSTSLVNSPADTSPIDMKCRGVLYALV